MAFKDKQTRRERLSSVVAGDTRRYGGGGVTRSDFAGSPGMPVANLGANIKQAKIQGRVPTPRSIGGVKAYGIAPGVPKPAPRARGPFYRGPEDLRSQFAGQGSYVSGPAGVYARPTPKPYRPMPAPTGTEAVVRPGVPGGQVKVISNVVRERPSPVPRARPASAPAPASRGVAPGTGGRMTKSQREAVAGPTGRSTGRIGVRTGGVAPGTGGRMTKAQRDAPAGPRGDGGGRVGTRTGGVAAGTGGRQTKSQRDAPAGPRGTRM